MAQTTAKKGTAAGAPNPFIKQLAANDRQTRDRAVSSLRTFLSRNSPFSDLDFLKLWKGLFFCMWSCDKPSPQRRLALDLSALVLLLSTPHNFLGFMRAFWQTMSREWTGIDALRMDKFLFLIRAFVNAAWSWLARNSWNDEEARVKYLGVLREWPLNVRDPKVPNGLRFHVADVYVDELEKVTEDKDAPFEEILAPLVELGKKSPTKSVRERVGEALDDDRVRKWLGVEEEEDDEDDEENEEGDDDEDEEFGGFDD